MYSNRYDTVRGRWTGKTYTLLKRLGKGGIGEIYLVADEYGGRYAMKVSQDIVSITKEFSNLEEFSDIYFAPKVYELDDFEKGGKVYHFFLMEYIQGYTLRDAITKDKLTFGNKLDIARIVAITLKEINNRGFIYTDLKYENIMIDRKHGIIRLVDLGSITPIGDRVREYTPMYDRSKWNSGNRKADLSYQVFTMGILLISMLLNRDMNPEREQLEKVMKHLEKHSFPKSLYDTVNDCLDGSIPDCGILYERLGAICRCSFAGRKLTYVLNAVIASLSVLLAVLIRAVFT